MNKEIKIMIELQRYWASILKAGEGIERCRKNILHWKGQQSDVEKKLAALNEDIKKLRADIKKEELSLSELDQKIKKLEERRNVLKSEREVEALEHELAKARGEDDFIEEKLIELMDSLSEREKASEESSAELDELKANVIKSVEKLEDDIRSNEETIKDYREKYDALVTGLSASHRPRFEKLLKSKGKAVGEVDGEVCGNCNFQIPSQLAHEASKDGNLVTCTNCGAYIYKEE